MDTSWNSPFIVPVGAFAMTLGIVVAGLASQAHAQRMKAEQRIAMVQRGMSAAEIEQLLGRRDEDLRPVKDPLRSLAVARRTGIVLVSTGVGIMLFFVVLSAVVHVREVLAGAAASLIPFSIGVGFFIDYFLQKRELSRFGLEVGAEMPSSARPR